MSAEFLREAATEMHHDAHLFSNQDSIFYHAVADWFDSVADACTSPDVKPGAGRAICAADEQAALRIAHAYMGDES